MLWIRFYGQNLISLGQFIFSPNDNMDLGYPKLMMGFREMMRGRENKSIE